MGDLGPGAYRFLDFLDWSGQTWWQVLPITPTQSVHGDCPYTSISAFAGNPLLISIEALVSQGLLSEADIPGSSDTASHITDYDAARQVKEPLFQKAYQTFQHQAPRPDYEDFRQRHASWLETYLLFKVIRDCHSGQPWSTWPDSLRNREERALRQFAAEHQEIIDYEAFIQYLFFSQWEDLKRACGERGIRIIGDLPIYVDLDSADVWAHPEAFKLDEKGKPEVVAGVPPDYFSKTGQRWGNPVYSWEHLKEQGYGWWMDRMRHTLELFDVVRLDHFRGFAAYWEIPASEPTAIHGSWVPGPGSDFFEMVRNQLGSLPIIAEDLGVITPDVERLRDQFGFPGMKILLFAFDESLPTNPYAPHNHIPGSLVYVGTHDNNTAPGWYRQETSPADRQRLSDYFGNEVHAGNVHKVLTAAAMHSVARTVILTPQDLLGLDEKARMNTPGTRKGNWQWRITEEQLNSTIDDELRTLTSLTHRLR